MTDNREAIERKAYELWEADGRPDGQHDHHWSRAEAMLAGAGEPSGGQGDPAANPAGNGGDPSAAAKSAPPRRRKAAGPAKSQDTSLGPSDDLPVGRPDPQRISP